MVVVSDIDGVLASFESAWNPLLTRLSGADKLPKGWQTDPGFPHMWDWDIDAYGKDVVKAAWEEVGKSPSFWKRLDPMSGAVEAAKQLNSLHRKHPLFFLTSRTGPGVQHQTCEWLYNLGINYPNVIVVSRYEDKWDVLDALRTTFFVDDKLETMQGWYNHCYKAGIKTTGSHYYALIDAPYNQEGRTVTGMRVAPNLTAALKEANLWL